MMTIILQVCKNVLCYLGDIIVYGETEVEQSMYIEVLRRVDQGGQTECQRRL